MRSGEIVVIGGVSTNNEGTDDVQTPLLGDIPVLAGCSRNNETQNQHTIVGIYCAASDLTYERHVISRSYSKAIRAAYQVKLIDDDGLAFAKQSANNNPKQTMLHELLEAKKLDPIKACQILGKLYQLKVITFKEYDINPDAVRKLPKDFIIRNQVIPLDLDNNVLRLAVATPRKRPYRVKLHKWRSVILSCQWRPFHILRWRYKLTPLNAIDARLKK